MKLFNSVRVFRKASISVLVVSTPAKRYIKYVSLSADLLAVNSFPNDDISGEIVRLFTRLLRGMSIISKDYMD